MSSNILGKNVVVNVYDHHERKLSGNRNGKIMDKVDWMVGCPVFVDDETGLNLGVNYECKILKVIDDNDS